MSAGHLRDSLTFQQRVATSDAYGNAEGAWEDQFTVAAEVRPKMGGETVIAARLSGTQPLTITLRYSSDTAQITPAWRAVDARDTTKIYNIRSVSNPDMRRRYIELMGDQGVAT